MEPGSERLGIAINIGVNRVDPLHYGDVKELNGCEFDAMDMAGIARACGFETAEPLLTEAATRDAVFERIDTAIDRLHSGDTLLLTFAGHGGRLRESGGDEDDDHDETWCLFDQQVIDDELYSTWARFRPGVRILVVSDSCHSGTVLSRFREKRAQKGFARSAPSGAESWPSGKLPRIRALTPGEAARAQERNQKLYRRLQRRYSGGRNAEICASVLLLSACRDHEFARDGERNGLFTAKLRQVWAEGGAANYLEFHKEIRRLVSLSNRQQRPSYEKEGVPSPDFELQCPFRI